MRSASPADDLFEALFDLSSLGSMLLVPLRDATGDLVDFSYERLNPAAQRLLALPERPAESFLTYYPHAQATGIFAFYREAFEGGEARRAEFNYQYDGLDNYYHLAARRVGAQLLVSFTDTSDQPRTAVEQALRVSQAAEQAARAEAEQQRLRLHQMLMRMPASIALLRGPEHRYELVNPAYEQLFPARPTLGRPLREVIPELAGQGFYELFDRVYETGEPHYDAETEAWADFGSTGQLQRRYYRTAFEPIRNAQGAVNEILNFAVDVTAQVEARQQVEQLNQELEARVQARTHELQLAQAATERQRRQWEEVFRTAPTAICIFDGPTWRYEFVNPGYQAMFPGRALLGKLLLDALPELHGQPLVDILRRVYDTGEPFEASEVLVPLARTEDGPVENIYFNLTYQARRNEAGQINGFITYAIDVTEQVLARRQADTMQAALLAATQRQVQQREELYQLFEQAPAAIVLLRAPDHRIEYVNPAYQQFFPGVALLGRLITDPDLATNGTLAHLDRVYQTGEPYVGEEQPVALALTPGQLAQTHYFNFTYQPYREEARIVGVTLFAYDVTEVALTRRRAAEQARQFQELYEQAPMAVTILRGPEFVVELANPAILRIWGQTAEEVLGRPRLDLIPETSRASLRAVLETAYRTHQPHHVQEFPVVLGRAHSGQPDLGYFNFIYQPLFDEHDQPVALTCVGIEVTEQVLARQQIEQLNQELEARVQQRTHEVQEAQAATERERAVLQAMFTQAPAAIALFQGEEVRVASVNERMAALWGRTPAQVLGLPLVEGVPELRGQGFDDIIRQVQATGVTYVGTEVPATILENGELVARNYTFSCQPIHDAQGALLGVINVGIDVTEQVRVRQQVEQLNQELEARVQQRTRQLSEQQALLSRILGQIPAALATVSGPEHRYTFFNEFYQAQVGHRAELGRSVAEALPEVVGQGYIDILDHVYATGELYEGREVPFQLHDPAEAGQPAHYLNFIYQPLFDGQGLATGILVFALDVTEQVLARRLVEESQQQVQLLNEELATINEELTATNEELHESNARLTRTNHDLDTFVYTASHDLKAPITNIEGILNALRETLPPEVQQDEVIAHIMELLDHTVGRFRLTIHQLTDLTRLQQTYNEPAERLRLAPVVADVLADLAPAVTAAQAQVHVDVPADLSVSFAPASLRSVVYNLLSNAVKYRSPERPAQVWLRAESRPGQVVLTVRDNGLGLTESQQGRLFGVFQRLHTHVEGTGVGLYMIKRLIENAGAAIAVTSTSTVGSTFTVTFSN